MDTAVVSVNCTDRDRRPRRGRLIISNADILWISIISDNNWYIGWGEWRRDVERVGAVKFGGVTKTRKVLVELLLWTV